MRLNVFESGDGFGCGTYGPVAIAVWETSASLKQAQAAASMLNQLAATEDPCFLLAILGPGAPPGDSEVRETIQSAIKRVDSRIGGVVNVVEGEGFRAAAMRAALTGMGLVIRSRYPNRSFGSIPEAASFVASLCSGKVSGSALVQATSELRREVGANPGR